MKKLLILGSTGSIGVSSLDVVRKFPGQFSVTALSTNSRIDLLYQQIEEFKPEFIVIKDKKAANDFNSKYKVNAKILTGSKGLIEITSTLDYDILINALVGFAGLNPTIEAIKREKRIALANKETLVVAGQLVTSSCNKYGAEIIPVDSEHSAILQSVIGENRNEINKLILTASGGPFLNMDINLLENVTVEQALSHPNWKMGNKITIDSASMMNKGLEVIEAHWLFDLPKEKIEVIIHPQSIIHSMVEFIDGSIKAQLSVPDMRLPIQFALSYPERYDADFVNTDFAKIKNLTFFEPDLDKFKCLKLAYDVMEEGGTAPCILNAANEIAVDKFLNRKIKFSQIPEIIQRSLDFVKNHKTADLETILDTDRQTREFALKLN